jgi:hypothetical protein
MRTLIGVTVLTIVACAQEPGSGHCQLLEGVNLRCSPGDTGSRIGGLKIEERTETRQVQIKKRYAVTVIDTSKCGILKLDASDSGIITSWNSTGTTDVGVHDEYAGKDVTVSCLTEVKP